MATAPKPKPKPEPPAPAPDPDDEEAATTSPVVEEPPSLDNLHERVDALFTSQVALIERVDKLEERMNAPPVGLGRRP
jgi:hypothetical protein